jgi:hypothetical protein
MQVSGNAITCAGTRAIAEAIAGNENTARAQLYGVELLEHRDILGLSDEDAFRDNAAILTALQERRRAEGVKSARGATRSHRRTHADIASLLCVRLCRQLGRQ